MKHWNDSFEFVRDSSRPAVLQICLAMIAGLVLVLAGSGLAIADDERSTDLLAEGCASCHGPEGQSPGAIPPIAGIPREVLADRLAAFKAGTDPDATIMPRIVAGYSQDELAALARYYTQRQKKDGQ